MNLNLSSTSLKSLATKLITFVQKNSVVLFILISLSLFGFLILKIKTYSALEPSESMIDSKTKQIQSVNIDKSAVDKIEQLKATNVEVKTLFEQSRDNPFRE